MLRSIPLILAQQQQQPETAPTETKQGLPELQISTTRALNLAGSRQKQKSLKTKKNSPGSVIWR
jgi:hypothetical protein